MKKKQKKIKTWFKKTITKAVKIYRKTKIWWIAICTILASCGTTKVTVQKPTEGSYTTITVTTNNPITTTPETNVDGKVNLNK